MTYSERELEFTFANNGAVVLTSVISPDVRSECVICVERKSSVPGMIGHVSISVLNS